MNELLFFLHFLIVGSFAMGALRLGKEGLTAFVSLAALLANLFVLKQVTLFGLTITCTDVLAIGSILALNLLQEHFGKASASKAAWICFYLMTFFSVMSLLHLAYKPSILDAAHFAYSTLLSPAPRLLLASLAVFFFVQQFDIRLYGWLKNRGKKRSLMFRSNLSLIISQFLDTALFTFFGLWGLVDALWEILLFSYAVKLFIIFSMTSFVSLSKSFILPSDHVPL
ncbi:MAG: hypothetical protein A2Y28_01790 [Chlamydiae bacterium GWC2_50_10]|nr:MAG: hypothetical protein A2Z85_02455 [Chlamydiae bacterium GWA2_50_15]OGN53551.1 MAG: hypothetical protein A2Y28_01790 [Chlamydiae bacterium GWC2_50_10]OGN69425.1 MAG: hypothetical protein A3I15_06100 [Chlamydiae bacterium RIFCSPLOWO2_02_FULL_49_12]OGN75458.1 MAG: hypothetical protein A3G30_02330 [Chlamydiae bacterium RIFCSPLOWO2_12_FULL_49_12]HCJ84561.1 hypothetical protein [Parachlamydiales bacterium]